MIRLVNRLIQFNYFNVSILIDYHKVGSAADSVNGKFRPIQQKFGDLRRFTENDRPFASTTPRKNLFMSAQALLIEIGTSADSPARDVLPIHLLQLAIGLGSRKMIDLFVPVTPR